MNNLRGWMAPGATNGPPFFRCLAECPKDKRFSWGQRRNQPVLRQMSFVRLPPLHDLNWWFGRIETRTTVQANPNHKLGVRKPIGGKKQTCPFQRQVMLLCFGHCHFPLGIMRRHPHYCGWTNPASLGNQDTPFFAGIYRGKHPSGVSWVVLDFVHLQEPTLCVPFLWGHTSRMRRVPCRSTTPTWRPSRRTPG